MSTATSPTPFDRPARTSNRSNSSVYKSGPLYISSKVLGWTSWKRRWFMLTRKALVFFKNDPNTYPSKGGDMNLTLGGIDLNNSASVLVRAEKKLLTVLFPDGRAFTLKAETVEDVDEWKDALERALQAAPNASTLSNSPSFQTEGLESIDGSSEPDAPFGLTGSNRRPVRSMVVGRPILLALEDIDGSPSFLEKALTFIETYGVGVEGILGQSADVEDVERRVRDYEQGRNQFSPDEDAHVIGYCIKHVLRELPSSLVPTPCCTALLDAQRLEGKASRVSSMKSAVTDTFPEPNRRLLQRVLRMMRSVSAHTDDNRMTASAVAACMAPLLLRPLLAGECGLEDESEVSPDNAAQLLAATAAANNAQSIVTTLLEEYDHIFEDYGLQRAPPSPQIYGTLEASETEASSDDEDDEVLHAMNEDEWNFHDAANDLHKEGDEYIERALSGTLSESSGNLGSDVFDYKAETVGDVDEWKVALERANASTLSNSPSFQTEGLESIDGSSKPGLTGSNRRPVRSMVVGRPLQLALEDIDGSLSFLEKALTFIEKYAQTARHYLQLTIECMERIRMRTLQDDSKSTDIKFNHEQCKYLATKLEWAIHCALLKSHFPENLAEPEDAAKCLELYMILLMLAKEVEGFIERCSKENWIQAAVILTNMSDHVWSLSFDLELCTMFFSFKKPRCLASEEFSDIRILELKLVKEKALIDDETLSACVKALIESGEASDDDFELATILLARIDRLRQQIPHLGTSESSQLSLHERSDISSLKYDVKIGNGGFGTVYKAIWCGVEVAVKTFHGPENPEFKKEVSICARVSHPNIASLLFYGVENGECSIVMELMDEDLQSLMRTRLRCNRTRESPFCIFVALDLMLQIAEGMSYLHRLRIVHRDLKSYNILVRCVKSTEANGHEYVHAKVADFGLSRTKEKSMTNSNQTPNMGTTRWMAPEMFEQGRLVNKEAYPFKSDVYSFAMVCYEILTGKFPFTTVFSNAEVRRKVLAGDRPELPDQCPPELRGLIERCWSPEARARPGFAEICLELAYLKSLQTSWSSVRSYVVDPSLPVVDKQVIPAESSEAESLAEVLAPLETEADSLARMFRLVQFKRELQELLISYSYVIPLRSFVIAYRRRYDKDLDVRDFGVNSLNALLQKVTDVAVLKTTTAKNFRGVTQMCLVAV